MSKNAGMSLAAQDLQAIQHMIDGAEKRIRAYVDEAIDSLAQQTAAGFQEVHEGLDQIEQRLDSIERAQTHERIRAEVHDEQISHITTTLRAV